MRKSIIFKIFIFKEAIFLLTKYSLAVIYNLWIVEKTGKQDMNLLKFRKTFLIIASILASHTMEKNNESTLPNESPLPKEIALCRPLWTIILNNMDEKTFLQTRQACKFFYNLSQKFLSLGNKSNQPEDIDSWLKSSKLKICLNLENTHNLKASDIVNKIFKCPNLQILKLGKVSEYAQAFLDNAELHILSKLKMVDLENLELITPGMMMGSLPLWLFDALLQPREFKKMVLPFRYFSESMNSLKWNSESLNMQNNTNTNNTNLTFKNVTITFRENEDYLKTQVNFVKMTMNGKTIYAKKPGPLNGVIISDKIAKLYFNNEFDEYGSPTERRDTIINFLLTIPKGDSQPEFIYNGFKD